MNHKQLRQFVAVADTLSFRKAAQALHMAQPPLSIAIKRLEEEVGTPLFSRSRTGVELTAVGASLVDEARLVLFHFEQFEKTFAATLKGTRGVLRLGFVGSATISVLPMALFRFRSRYPDVRLELVEGSTPSILDAITGGRLDVGLIRTPVHREYPLAISPVEPDTLVAALRQDHPLAARGGAIRLRDLAGQPLVVYSSKDSASLHAQVLLACQSAGFRPHVVQEAIHVHTVLSLVQSGIGIGFVPAIVRSRLPESVVLCEIRGAAASLQTAIALAWRSRPDLNVVQRFRAVVQDSLASP